jgi:hypothetical protein
MLKSPSELHVELCDESFGGEKNNKAICAHFFRPGKLNWCNTETGKNKAKFQKFCHQFTDTNISISVPNMHNYRI